MACPCHRYLPDLRKALTRLFRVQGLRSLQTNGLPAPLVIVDCPDLRTIRHLSGAFVLKGCPRLSKLPPLGNHSLVHIERCASLRSLEPVVSSESTQVTCQTLILAECPRLRRLPANLQVAGRMILRRLGHLQRWPENLEVGGDLLIQDCPDFQELPVMRVGGSLRMEGASQLRRLTPGTHIGLHLDLRACSKLESIPQGVVVGGCMFLPPHLHRADTSNRENARLQSIAQNC